MFCIGALPTLPGIKLKFSIPDYIKSEENISKHISSIQVAPKEDGGEGALLIKLKKL